MSTNLHCEEMDLVQTPTYITHIIALRHNGSLDNWKNILYKYKEWNRMRHQDGFNSMINDPKAQKEWSDQYTEWMKNHFAALDSYKILHFYIM